MIDTTYLLPALQSLAGDLHTDLITRSTEVTDVDAKLRQLHSNRKKEKRSDQSFEEWRDEFLTQVAVAWVLGCVFVRYLEDNRFLGDYYLAGPSPSALSQAKHNFQTFLHKTKSPDAERDYLHDVFRRMEKFDAVKDLFAEGKTPLWAVAPSNAAAIALLEFFQHQDPDEDEHVPEWRFDTAKGDTEFLGNLYQELSEDIQKKYALLQTPPFVRDFILDRTLEPAAHDFGFENVRLIDPTCGSGHFLLGAFKRQFSRWEEQWQHTGSLADTNRITLAQKALDQVYGVDLNPYAVAICKFRLLIAALVACEKTDLANLQKWRVNVTVGDSLIHGRRFNRSDIQRGFTDEKGKDLADPYEMEDPRELNRILGQQYHAVVGNPPYIEVPDRVISQRYKEMYATCYGRYHLSSPFTERFFDLALPSKDGAPTGYVGLILDNAFMKRDFGKALVKFLTGVDLTHIVGMENVPVPGHGTPTVILIGRNRKPVELTVRAVLGIKSELPPPDVPQDGKVWKSIIELLDKKGENEFISAVDMPRTRLDQHPWSMGGGGAADLKDLLDSRAEKVVDALASSIGITAVSGEDGVYPFPDRATAIRHGVSDLVRLVTGDAVREWMVDEPLLAAWPYDKAYKLRKPDEIPTVIRYLWPYKTSISQRKRFGTPMLLKGAKWYEWQELYDDKLLTDLFITWGEITTHNNFALDRGGRLFNRTAPVVKLKEQTLPHHLAILGLLNSSTAGFWMRQVCFPKGGDQVQKKKARVRRTWWEERFAFASRPLGEFPIPKQLPDKLPARLDSLAQQYSKLLPAYTVRQALPTRGALDTNRVEAENIRRQMIALQEELDWQVYHLYGLTADPLTYGGEVPPINHGERAFEILMARNKIETEWFKRHGSEATAETPELWPDEYKVLVKKRIKLIESDKNIRLIEQPENKRRWSLPKFNKKFPEVWKELEQEALKGWLLDRLETAHYWPRPQSGQPSPAVLRSCRELAELTQSDKEFRDVGALYRGGDLSFDVEQLVTELVLAESAPFLPVLRYTDSGLIGRQVWERVWEQQRAADKNKDTVGEVPPKYTKDDFRTNDLWRLRGELDVPKERWVSYPHLAWADGGEPSPIVTWAGYNYLDQAFALYAYYDRRKSRDTGARDWLLPLTAGFLQLLPWLLQWHNEPDAAYGGERMGSYFQSLLTDLDAELSDLGRTREDALAWKPAAPAPKTKAKKSAPRAKKSS